MWLYPLFPFNLKGLSDGIDLQALLMAWIWETIPKYHFYKQKHFE
jgi:hypothetical protein